MTQISSDAPRCSAWARQADIDPIGTAGTYRGVVCVEWPLPWPRDPAAVVGLGGAAAVLEPLGVRLQLLRPHGLEQHRATVLSFRRDDGFFRRFDRLETRVDAIDVAETVVSLARGELSHETVSEVVDVLVCTHGSRDVCCGSSGTRLAADLNATQGGDSAALPDSVRVWSTSHLGGHRFAPTAIVMPSGTCWAYLDRETLRRIITRSGGLEHVLAAYRGCIGIGSRRAQALERVAFRDTGWSWLDHWRQGRDTGGNTVEIDALSAGGHRFTWSGLVVDGRELPIPVCREPISVASKSEHELVVSAYERRG